MTSKTSKIEFDFYFFLFLHFFSARNMSKGSGPGGDGKAGGKNKMLIAAFVYSDVHNSFKIHVFFPIS